LTFFGNTIFGGLSSMAEETAITEDNDALNIWSVKIKEKVEIYSFVESLNSSLLKLKI